MTLSFYINLICFLLISRNVFGEESPIIKIKQGHLSGFTSKTHHGKQFMVFHGIPYAEPPINELRFQPPVEKKPWKGVFKADTEKECYQRNLVKGTMVGEEDCLVLNVYTRDVIGSKPVMLWIHGGAFASGSGASELYGPEYLMDKDIVLITINYRIGPLGFLSTGDDLVPGNQGMLDQIMALKWVQDNIKAFGGNPDKVTIFGESAGGMSTMLHHVSPRSKGLFHRIIAQSGGSLSLFLHTDKNPIYYTRTLCSQIPGCDPKSSPSDIISSLRKVSVETLVDTGLEVYPLELMINPFKPIVDNFAREPFLPQEPYDLIRSGKFNDVPIILGNNHDEGLIVMGLVYLANPKNFDQFRRNLYPTLGSLLLSRDRDELTPEDLKFLESVFKDLFQGKYPTSEDYEDLKNAIGDTYFNAIGSLNTRMIAAKSTQPVYEYVYNHRGYWTFPILLGYKVQIGIRLIGQKLGFNWFESPVKGVSHVDDLFSLFKSKVEFRTEENDVKVSERMLTLWTDFAINGTPNKAGDGKSKWEKINPSKKQFKQLWIETETDAMKTCPDFEKRFKFWEKYFQKHPPMMHLKSSQTWSHPELYDQSFTKSKSQMEL